MLAKEELIAFDWPFTSASRPDEFSCYVFHAQQLVIGRLPDRVLVEKLK